MTDDIDYGDNEGPDYEVSGCDYDDWQDDDFADCDEPYGVDDVNSAFYDEEEFA
jgi:hypothetical protein